MYSAAPANRPQANVAAIWEIILHTLGEHLCDSTLV
jgi:hypothetical protein